MLNHWIFSRRRRRRRKRRRRRRRRRRKREKRRRRGAIKKKSRKNSQRETNLKIKNEKIKNVSPFPEYSHTLKAIELIDKGESTNCSSLITGKQAETARKELRK